MPKKATLPIKSDVEKYDKKTQREHILLRPGLYIGDIEINNDDMWVCSNNEDDDSYLIKKEKIKYSPGFLKILDEIIINARDAAVNDTSVDIIKIECNQEEGFISVYNNGDIGIPIEEHPIHKLLVPYMIFGELNTSSNYDDNDERITGGCNGVGSKICNVFSTEFIVEIDDAKRNKRYKQVWKENMSIVEDPIISKLPAKTKSSVKITFYPDFKRFGLEDLDDYHFKLFHKRTIDIAGTFIGENKLKVYFNNNKLDINTFKSYIDLYYPNSEIFYDSNDRWQIGVLYKPDIGGEVISFVNSINTYRGGTHCNYIIDNIYKVLINDYIKKKSKDIKITNSLLKDNFIFFINSIIVNPGFVSQTKDTLSTKVNKFGSVYELNQTFIKKIAKCGIVEQIIDIAKYKESSSLKKTDGKKQIRILGIPKLEDANKAGTKESDKCTLILTEGDSAKATAMSGLGIVGRDYYGVFPLKGKLLNVRDASPSQLLANEEITHLKTILGLKQSEDYSNIDKFNTLRYGHVLLLTDSDLDGSHIKGLFINLLHSLWPSLVKCDDFIQCLNTPIIKATKNKNDILEFYTLDDYEEWKKLPESNNYKIKYYKGLGTSTAQEAKEYFTDINNKRVKYFWESVEKDDDAITLAFDKSRANDRKKWLVDTDSNDSLSNEQKSIQIYDFIHKDLKKYSNEDNIRSIPSVIDGLKPSQRKIVYGAFLRGLDKDEVKVAQLAGFVSDRAAYHHGEMSLNGAIIGMAQNFTGSNNINILKPIGQFGTKYKSGKDYASPRYIWTMLEELSPIIFNSDDNPVLNHQTDDGIPIEPEYYCPIIPMILVNGTEGIGTGFSTKIPPYNPKDIIINIRNLLNNKEFIPMDPWWQGFNGIIKKIDNYNYEIYGNWHIKNSKLIITELPVGEATYNYKEFLEKILEDDSKKNKDEKKKIKKKDDSLISYKDNNTDVDVYFELIFEDDYLENLNTEDINKIYHLCKKYSITNMHLYSPSGHIKKYDNVEEIMKDYFYIRLDLYQKRKDYQLNILEYQLKLISFKVKFILNVIDKKIDVNNKKRSDIEEKLEELEFPKFGKNKDDTKLSYDYLLSMPIYNLSFEKVEEFKKIEKDKETEYNELKDMSIKDIWLNELDLLEKKYNKWMNNKLNNDVPKSKKKINKKNI